MSRLQGIARDAGWARGRLASGFEDQLRSGFGAGSTAGAGVLLELSVAAAGIGAGLLVSAAGGKVFGAVFGVIDESCAGGVGVLMVPVCGDVVVSVEVCA
jgi:hypothetical protein